MEPEPVFAKMLSDTDVSHRLSFPLAHLGILPQVAGNPDDPVEFQVSCGESGDEVRTFRCIKRRNGPQKPVILGGWSSLVEDKGVQMGDELQFYMQASDDGATHYWIKIYRYIFHHDERGTSRITTRIV